jgi:hypothetical protein
MAFESVNKKINYKKLTDLKEGEQLTGYVTNITDSTKIEGQKNITMVIDGQETLVSPSGNVRYLLQDGKIALGALTRITRIADKMVKGKKSTQFDVEQDSESVYAKASSAAVSASSKIESLKTNAAKV